MPKLARKFCLLVTVWVDAKLERFFDFHSCEHSTE
jgi:hypothetical protein